MGRAAPEVIRDGPRLVWVVVGRLSGPGPSTGSGPCSLALGADVTRGDTRAAAVTSQRYFARGDPGATEGLEARGDGDRRRLADRRLGIRGAGV
jgi:hypothetical protein